MSSKQLTESHSRHAQIIAREIEAHPGDVAGAMRLLAEGNTVPFIARYRKEATGGLSDTQLRHLETRWTYLRELDERRETIREAIAAQGKLTDELNAELAAVDSKARLEDLYLPYKTTRRTKGAKARAAGLEPYAEYLLGRGPVPPQGEHAGAYLCSDFPGERDVRAGARAIVVEAIATNAQVVGRVREEFASHGRVVAGVHKGKETVGAKYRDYFDFQEPFANLPSHRILALLRGEEEGVLRLTLDGGHEEEFYEGLIAELAQLQPIGEEGPDAFRAECVRYAWRTKLAISSAVDVRGRLKERADAEAVEVFARNLKDLLLAAPAGQRATLGLDPGYRNGVKCAVVDPTGKVLDTAIVYPHTGKGQWEKAAAILRSLVVKHHVELLAVGNGTASRETEKLAREICAAVSPADEGSKRRPVAVMVSESGASVYSASEVAAREFPDMDVSLRGAVSIARRLQDPLAELVKIDPKSIGVGQYQHDVNQSALAAGLDSVVEDAVNSVGVDVNTASAELLRRVAGVNQTVAQNIVAHRDSHGAFARRAELKKVPRLGEKVYEQAAGFLRIHGGADPLDESAVHPEAYPLVGHIAQATGAAVPELIGNTRLLRTINPADYTTEAFGLPTVRDVISELDKPGRDPRPEFVTAALKEGVESISDLSPGMILEGTVTNVAAFGAFVDIGVHQDGLVHVSAMSDRFVADPHDVVRSGQVVKVKVLEVDANRQRIGLSLRLSDSARRGAKPRARAKGTAAKGTMAGALRRAGFGR
ncbi:Tex family protein [Corynebacterium heidelbergense]|uniref:RNA-binding transcriptional accessory protein n=1 Tax=Corynebacterium heidelbergense TaxID=2055947 RepID=A0A364VCW5_9CORY|nr:Tex family protein [Corynebacterium heidelbergense]RAV34471.1 RNA-binding transcriptional accessory protein [Corynebacterium heidelbergense]WCZ36770.1 hypothetical protein CHEID_06165 [Corynebacterium heidelbergense]